MILHKKFEQAFAHAVREARATGRRMRVFRYVIESPVTYSDRYLLARATYWAIREVGA